MVLGTRFGRTRVAATIGADALAQSLPRSYSASDKSGERRAGIAQSQRIEGYYLAGGDVPKGSSHALVSAQR